MKNKHNYLIEKLPLKKTKAGLEYIVESIECKREFSQYLLSLGICPKAPIRIITNSKNNPILIKIQDARYFLNETISDKIYVVQKELYNEYMNERLINK